MKTTMMILVFTMLFAGGAGAWTLPTPADGKLTPDEKAKAIKALHDSQNELRPTSKN